MTEQKNEIWDRWQRGESQSSIGRLFERESSSIFGLLSPSGGIRLTARTRSKLSLTLAEREEISRGIVCQLSFRTNVCLISGLIKKFFLIHSIFH